MCMTFQSITTTKRFQIKLIIWENNTFAKQLKTIVAFFRENFKWKATDSMPMAYQMNKILLLLFYMFTSCKFEEYLECILWSISVKGFKLQVRILINLL